MCRKLIYLLSSILVLGMASNVYADLVGHWTLDEGSGNVAHDTSGNGNDGTFNGDPQWVSGFIGSALEFDGVDDYVAIGDLDLIESFTLTFWMRPSSLSSGWHSVVMKEYDYGFEFDGTSLLGRVGNGAGGWGATVTTTISVPAIWYHAALTWNGSDLEMFIDASSVGQNTGTHVSNNDPLLFASWNTSSEFFNGTIDDVRIYDRALSEPEILGAMEGEIPPYAWGPDPKDGALHPDTWVTLSWKPGPYAVSHDVYLGDDFDIVDAATPDSAEFRGNQGGTFLVAGFPGFPYPDGLIPGTTYYWRVDEVNDADPNSPWKGPVWSFSIPPKTAYFPDPPDGAGFVGPDNVTLSWTPGFGAKLHIVYFGEDYDKVNNATVGVPSGTAFYSPGALEREKVYYWRVDEFDGFGTYKGNIWSFTTPGAVGNPQPAYDATDVQLNMILSWTPADSTALHELYFGTDEDAVRGANTGSPEYKGSKALGAESHDPGLLEPDTNYYWRVDEVDAQGNTSTGPIWIFTTGAFLLIDDFEAYTDDDAAGKAIWQTWIDGFGVADNGAQVGNLLPPYAEQPIVHGGAQSMPLLYRNEAGVTNSEAAMTLTAPRDWTQAGVAELSLWFRGTSGNAEEPLYVAVSNSAGSPAVVTYDDPGAATIRAWTQWQVPLQAFTDQGINLTDVDKIAVGLGSNGGVAASGSGTMYIDDIRLYRSVP